MGEVSGGGARVEDPTVRAAPAPTSRRRFRAAASAKRGWWLAGAALLVAVVLLLVPGGPAASSQPVAGREAPVTPWAEARPLAHNSPALAADPTDARFVALASRTDNPDFSCSLHVSGNGGQGWVLADPVPELPEGAEKCYAPEVFFDRDGLLYYTFVGLHGLGNNPMGLFLTTSADRARTWSRPLPVLGPRVYMPRVTIDPDAGSQGRIHAVWVQASSQPATGGFPPGDNPVLAAHSDDGGRSWSAPVRVSDPGRERVVAPALVVGDGGAVHVLYYDLGDDERDYRGLEGPTWEGHWSLVAASSTDGGASFEKGVVVDDALVPPERIMVIFTAPAAALAAGRDGRLYAGWWDARHGDWDVFVAASRDGGRSWAEPSRANGDPVGNGRHQYLPRLAVAPGGRVDAVFYDRRDDAENMANDVSYTFSTDGARRFAPSLRLTTQRSDSRVGPTFTALPSSQGLFELGSRLGLLARQDGALAAWADTRNGEPGLIRQDIVAATANFPDEARDLVGASVIALAVAGVAVAWAGRRQARAGKHGGTGERAEGGEL